MNENRGPDGSNFKSVDGVERSAIVEQTAGPELTDDEIEDVIDAALQDNSEHSDLMNSLSVARREGNKDAEKETVAALQSLRESKKVELGFGIAPDHQHGMDKERIIQAFAELDGTESDKETLMHLKMLDENGRFTYPYQLFSEETNDAWERYIDAVKKHQKIVDNASEFGATPAELKAVDDIRVRYHNEFTRLLMQDLKMDADVENEFYLARQLAAKMRDAKMPNMGEMAVAAKYAKYMLDAARRNLYKDDRKVS